MQNIVVFRNKFFINKCNLKCSRVEEKYLSTWIKEEKQLNAMNPEWMSARKEGKYPG